ncbi:SDR family NAD(P)-dependent oxidoreductase [Actinomadura sp. KC216]|uniref:SDR family NAD(P)-dependent oxidoreductase n=1 Tax=Actinomadura sp. KC216 TaxID=2530370 RepID=UPI0010494298|nr:SDR family NAD(P)-dependent oxidoreductase [Actinomadura sp. KC216]TDB85150.1 SDR family NAD(P)-dependent oxidoreductase [Actinomadura sp. KC216]
MRWFPPHRPRRAAVPAADGVAPPPAGPFALLLDRDEIVLADPRGRRLVRGRRVLVTGACGTVGGALCRRVRRLGPAALCLVDKDGRGLERLARELAGEPGGCRVTLAAADVRDADRVDAVVGDARPELLFHAAGLHRLSAVEDDPCRGVADNVLGTRHVVDSAVRHGVRRLVLVSSDRAAEPTSVLGATMRLGELLLRTATGGPTCFAAVRVGDVIGAPGAPLGPLAPRIAAGEVITVAHPEAARHVMTVAEAAGLLIEAAALAEEAETFALDLGGPVPVVDLVQRYAAQLHSPAVTIRFSGLRPGEKLAEKAFADSEPRLRTAHPKIWGTRAAPPPAGLPRLLDALAAAAEAGDADGVRLLLRRLLPEYRPPRRPLPACEVIHDNR